MASRPHIIALIVAAGSGSRAGGSTPKQFCKVKGQPMLRHSYAVFSNRPEIESVVLVIGAGQENQAQAAVEGLPAPLLVTGGATRRESVRNGLAAIAQMGGADYVLIHDAARPFLPEQVIDDLLNALLEAPGAVPALPMVDSIARGTDILTETVERENLWRIQTPQAFHFSAIHAAHLGWSGAEPTDDARMLMANGLEVHIVPGDDALTKMTFAKDFSGKDMITSMRSGTGFDVHRLVAGEQLWLCGVLIPYDKGLSGHSDADVALHALTDAMLGALALGDIGDHFPPSDPQWKGASSDRFLAHAMKLARDMGYELSNVDVTIICEAPKIGPHRSAMRARIAEITGTDIERISVKATTTELLGFTGRGEGIAAQAIATFEKPN
ncbi:bifunctional 2-C-methyl-D-erythritol 4-phosphate cytidylyltransferase/2-C-methyl-D-erythritol 2,4-cyclodiphosphate synthase [Sphingorhabdus sp. IMCC26285]|uniref:Bifunctional enzyme IspD/IspF n=1 Tax=Sphingorhabdus profundilacus TaxID=2509718 RepID=A0A6I4LY05_9SPHN|nr:bifunctional 2-C-methyl-D-erythritol 4-phosphate cytidylyltransferase/2-C-methyl-D-erythritol 2,4-cyclodiphosphate synthase [Sphingorhabdus profundilacus]MVZ96920.1 bifunctional 2-C-methyl-D-erythritol 4-phosphate cytidylyltransferase/2-C-methyl-D-erythritol 2,4-cyclodiphosphate synthase [Sphingorhabdus profundilacus]